MRIMVVDDDRAVRDIIAYGVGQVSVVNRVDLACDAEAALKAFKPGEFDCLVVDYKLPGMNGIDFIREIRKEDDNVGIVMVTGAIEHANAENLCEGLGVYAVVTKPFSNKMLSEKIQEACELSRMSPEKKAQFESAIETSTVKIRDLSREIRAQCAIQRRGMEIRRAL